MSKKPILPIDEMMPEIGETGKDIDPRPRYWEYLSKMSFDEVCRTTGAELEPGNELSLEFLGDRVLFDVKGRQVVDDEGNLIEKLLTDEASIGANEQIILNLIWDSKDYAKWISHGGFEFSGKKFNIAARFVFGDDLLEGLGFLEVVCQDMLL